MTITSASHVKRTSDGKLFHVAVVGHWSDVTSDDGETDTIKWYAGKSGDAYVSMNKGHAYELVS